MLNYKSTLAFKKHHSGGFTLIELMIVVSIVAILVALAVPAYQQYSIRAKITECMAGAAPAKLAVSEYKSTEGEWPPDLSAAALSSTGETRYCSGFIGYDPDVGSFQINVNEIAVYPTLGQVQPQLTPQQTAIQNVGWRCTRGATAPENVRYLPATCRGT